MAQALRRKIAILLLVLYWPVLFVLAHIPMPDIVRKAGASDKTLHFLAYMVLVFLLWGAIESYQKVQWRKAAVWWLLLLAVGYGAIDEWLQGYVGRTPDLMDLLADVTGAVTSLVLLSILDFWLAATAVAASGIFILNCLTRADLTRVLPATNLALHLFGYALVTALWVHYGSLRWPGRPGAWTSAVRALVLPIGLLAVVELVAWSLGKRPTLAELAMVGTGIAVVAAAAGLAGRRTAACVRDP
jgi:VanZ family protein